MIGEQVTLTGLIEDRLRHGRETMGVTRQAKRGIDPLDGQDGHIEHVRLQLLQDVLADGDEVFRVDRSAEQLDVSREYTLRSLLEERLGDHERRGDDGQIPSAKPGRDLFRSDAVSDIEQHVILDELERRIGNAANPIHIRDHHRLERDALMEHRSAIHPFDAMFFLQFF